MSILEWVYLGLFVTGLLFSLTTVTLIILIIYKKNKMRKLAYRKKYNKKIKRLKKENKKNIILLIISTIVTIGSISGTVYISYYQSVNLTEEDSQSVVEGYYYLADFKQQLELIQTQSIEEKKAIENIQNLSGYLASYSSKRASNLNTEDGQVILNRYYNVLKELGINASRETADFLENEQLIDDFLDDIKKSEKYQDEVFKYYKVDESALKSEL